MAQTNVNIRMDENLKQQFDHICKELGLNMSTAFNIFVKDSYARAAGWLGAYSQIV